MNTLLPRMRLPASVGQQGHRLIHIIYGLISMPISIEALQRRISLLQDKQKNLPSDQPFSSLEDEVKHQYIQINKKLGVLVYECYERLKEIPNAASLAAEYFICALFELDYPKAADLLRIKLQELEIENHEPIFPVEPYPNNAFNLSIQYLLGVGFPQSKANTIAMLEIAVKQKNPNAQALLGQFYDASIRSELYKGAALRGSAYAQKLLGDALYAGVGSSPDYINAVKWYKAAAEQGFKSAQTRLGLMYFANLGVDISERERHTQGGLWLKSAADQGHPEGQYEWGLKLNQPELCYKAALQSTQYKGLFEQLHWEKDCFLLYYQEIMKPVPDQRKIIDLVVNQSVILDSLIFDFIHADILSPTYNVLLEIFQQLLAKSWPMLDSLPLSINQSYIRKLINISDELNLYQEPHTQESVENTVLVLSQLKVEQISTRNTSQLINLIVEAWYRSRNCLNEADMTIIAGELLSKLLFKCLSADIFHSIDELHNCLLICVKHRFGSHVEIGFSQHTDNLLALFLLMNLVPHLSVKKINQFLAIQIEGLGPDFIRSSQSGQSETQVLEQLVDYLTSPAGLIKCTESNALHELNQFLQNNWLPVRDQHDSAITVFRAMRKSVVCEKYKIGFFEPTAQNTEVDQLFSQIQKCDFEGLLAYLANRSQPLKGCS